MTTIDYDEFGLFHENAAEYGVIEFPMGHPGRRWCGASRWRFAPASA